MKLVYWYAQRLDDHKTYSVRERTKRAAKAAVAEMPDSYGPVEKVVVEYKDAFDLISKALGEGGIEPC